MISVPPLSGFVLIRKRTLVRELFEGFSHLEIPSCSTRFSRGCRDAIGPGRFASTSGAVANSIQPRNPSTSCGEEERHRRRRCRPKSSYGTQLRLHPRHAIRAARAREPDEVSRFIPRPGNEPSAYDFSAADRLVDFASLHNRKVPGHCFVSSGTSRFPNGS